MTLGNSSRREFCRGAGALGLAFAAAPSVLAAAPAADVLARRRAWAAPSDGYTPFHELFESEVVRTGSWISPLPEATEPFDLTFEFDGRTYTLDDYQRVTKTYGLVVIKDGRVLH